MQSWKSSVSSMRVRGSGEPPLCGTHEETKKEDEKKEEKGEKEGYE